MQIRSQMSQETAYVQLPYIGPKCELCKDGFAALKRFETGPGSKH